MTAVPPPADLFQRANLPGAKGGQTGLRTLVEPPTGWTMSDLQQRKIDFDCLDVLITYYETKQNAAALRALAKLRPSDSACEVPRKGHHKPQNGDKCFYCLFNKPAAAGTPEANLNHRHNYRYGNGDGNHSPHQCMAFKCVIAEGGPKVCRDLAMSGHIKQMLVPATVERK